MSKKYDAKLFQERTLNESFKNSEELAFPNVFFEAINQGRILKDQSLSIEYKRFDEEWFNNLETFFPSLIQITKDLKSSLKYEEEILPVEKTRRTNPESIRHLLRNTRYIKDIDENGSIIPDKVLNTLSEVDYGIYENRFIMTLIDRLYNYLLNRIEVIRQNILGNKEMNFIYKNEFNIDEVNYSLDFNIRSNEDIDIKEIDVHNYRIYELANEAFKVVSRIYHGNFMKVLKKHQKVKAPIMKTQIILKNTNFKNAYLLWLYLDRVNALDYTLERKTKVTSFSDNYNKQIEHSLLLMFSTVFNNSNFNVKDTDVKTENIKPIVKEDTYGTNLKVVSEPYILEPNLATEYHLKKTKQLISKQYSNILTNTKNKEQSLKQVLLDQYSVANQIYNHYFENNQDSDVFEQLINFSNPVRNYDESLNKYLITKVQREVSEKLYSDALILETKWINEATKNQKVAFDFIVNKETNDNNKILEKLNKDTNKELNSYDKTLSIETKKQLSDLKKVNVDRITKLKNKNKEALKVFKEKEKIRFNLEKEKIKEKAKKEKLRLKEKELKIREKEKERMKKKNELEKEQLRKKLMKEKEKIKLSNQNKLNKQK